MSHHHIGRVISPPSLPHALPISTFDSHHPCRRNAPFRPSLIARDMPSENGEVSCIRVFKLLFTAKPEKCLRSSPNSQLVAFAQLSPTVNLTLSTHPLVFIVLLLHPNNLPRQKPGVLHLLLGGLISLSTLASTLEHRFALSIGAVCQFSRLPTRWCHNRKGPKVQCQWRAARTLLQHRGNSTHSDLLTQHDIASKLLSPAKPHLLHA